MKHSAEILSTLERNRDRIKRYGVKRIGLFGSAVRHEATPSSDLDFLVDFEKKSFDAYMDLKLFLEELFGCRVDLVLSDSIKPRLKARILQEVLYAPGI